MLCIRGTSHGPVSVCLSVRPSVTSRCSTKTAKRKITQTTPHDSPGALVFGRAYFNVPTGTDVLADLKSVLEGLVTRA